MCPQNRRDLLALAGATATSIAAGCLSTGEGEFSTTSTDDDESTTTDDAADATDEPADTTSGAGEATATVDGAFAATTWLPAPGSDFDPYLGFAGDLAALRDADVTENALRRTTGTTLVLPADVLAGDEVVELATVQPLGTVCTFTPETAEVRSRLAATAAAATRTTTVAAGTTAGDDGDATETKTRTAATASRVDAPDGYEGYETRRAVCWLGADHLLYGPTREFVRAMYDARAGDRDRYAANADVSAVLDAAGDADLLAVAARSQQVVADASAFTYAWRFGDTVELTVPFAFPDADASDPDAVASLGEYAGFAEYERTDVRTDGRVVTFTGDIGVDEFDLLERDDGGGTATAGGDAAPQVSFSFEYHQGDGDAEERVVVTHQGGDNVDLANVALHYDGSDVAKSDAFASTKPTGETWAAGGEWTLRVDGDAAAFESDATLQVVWTGDDGGRSAVIATFELP